MLLFVAFASLALFAEACDPISVYCALTPIMRHNVQIRVNRDPGSDLIHDFLKH